MSGSEKDRVGGPVANRVATSVAPFRAWTNLRSRSAIDGVVLSCPVSSALVLIEATLGEERVRGLGIALPGVEGGLGRGSAN